VENQLLKLLKEVMLQLNNLESLTKDRKRRGRGGSRGGTSGRGHKGQRARSGGKSGIKPFFEGGQMPLTRRLPRRGFTNRFRKEYVLVSLSDLEHKFSAGEVVTHETLRACGLLKAKQTGRVKIIGNGVLSKALTVQVRACTHGARAKIEQAGGSIQSMKEMGSDSTST